MGCFHPSPSLEVKGQCQINDTSFGVEAYPVLEPTEFVLEYLLLFF